jgi:DNA invertase Pin-like site-specific DNA recombinase
MISEKLKELQALQAKTAALEQELAQERQKQIASLPAQYGFASAEDFIAAVRAASAGGAKRRGRKAKAGKPATAAAAASKPGKRRKRAVITDETRGEVKKMVESGKTGAEIAKALGISLPSVQNIKKALGLVGKRKK